MKKEVEGYKKIRLFTWYADWSWLVSLGEYMIDRELGGLWHYQPFWFYPFRWLLVYQTRPPYLVKKWQFVKRKSGFTIHLYPFHIYYDKGLSNFKI